MPRAGGVGLWDWSLKTDEVHYSREWKRQLGYEEHELSNAFEEWRSRIHPDDLERALQAAGLDPEGDSEDPLAHGVLLVFRNLRESLGRSGIEVVDPKGEKFDPNLAEALSTVQVDGTEAGVVVEVMQKGYRFDGHLIRPAMVVVAA